MSKINGTISGAINASFIALIHKYSQPDTLSGFCPIYLCKLVYKVIRKVVASRLKPYLYNFISKEQFVFLFNKQILDAVGVA